MADDSTYAATPFDHAKADVILRSSDNVDFRVFKLFLSLASPFFATLFDIPRYTEVGDQEVKDGLAVVHVTEDSKTLDALLRFCYPCTLADDPKMEVLQNKQKKGGKKKREKDVLQHAADILEAAEKYTLDLIQTKVCRAIAKPKFSR